MGVSGDSSLVMQKENKAWLMISILLLYNASSQIGEKGTAMGLSPQEIDGDMRLMLTET